MSKLLQFDSAILKMAKSIANLQRVFWTFCKSLFPRTQGDLISKYMKFLNACAGYEAADAIFLFLP